MGVKASLPGYFAWKTILIFNFGVSRMRMRLKANGYLKVDSTVTNNLRMRVNNRKSFKATNS